MLFSNQPTLLDSTLNTAASPKKGSRPKIKAEPMALLFLCNIL